MILQITIMVSIFEQTLHFCRFSIREVNRIRTRERKKRRRREEAEKIREGRESADDFIFSGAAVTIIPRQKADAIIVETRYRERLSFGDKLLSTDISRGNFL